MPLVAALDTSATHLTTFMLKAGGSSLGEEYQIVSIDIRREANRIPKAEIVLLDGDAAAQTFAHAEEETLIPGVEIEILGGYSSSHSTLFKGIIVRQRIEIGAHGGSHLIVEAHDPVFRMSLGRHSHSFTDATDAEIIEALIERHTGLQADVTPTSTRHRQVVQHQISDWDFLVMRAELADLLVLCVDGQVQVAPPPSAGRAAASAIFGQGLLAAELELDASEQLNAVEVGAWSAARQEWLSTRCEDAATPGPGKLRGSDLAAAAAAASSLGHPGELDPAQLEQSALAEMGRIRRAAVRGRLRVQGRPELLPGILLELGGLGGQFNGLALVSAVRHRLGRGDWLSEVRIGLSARSHAERYPLAAVGASQGVALLPGLYTGTVTALAGDPAGEGRIQLRLVTIGGGDGLLWARQAVPDAGTQRGICFRPEIGDEVLVGFLAGDPQHPVILGALHSSAKPAPLEASDDNHHKGIVTRSGMRIQWDDEHLVTTIDTPAGNRIVLSEQERSILIADQYRNRVELGADGIAVESQGELQIKAAGALRIEAQTIELSAKANLKAQATGTAELSSRSNTVVKGKLVQIN